MLSCVTQTCTNLFVCSHPLERIRHQEAGFPVSVPAMVGVLCSLWSASLTPKQFLLSLEGVFSVFPQSCNESRGSVNMLSYSCLLTPNLGVRLSTATTQGLSAATSVFGTNPKVPPGSSQHSSPSFPQGSALEAVGWSLPATLCPDGEPPRAQVLLREPPPSESCSQRLALMV